MALLYFYVAWLSCLEHNNDLSGVPYHKKVPSVVVRQQLRLRQVRVRVGGGAGSFSKSLLLTMHEAHLYVKHVRCLHDLKRDVILMASLVPRLFLVGGMRKGRSMEFFDSCEATKYKFIAHTLNVKPHVNTTHSHKNLFMIHTYLTFAHQHWQQEYSHRSTLN